MKNKMKNLSTIKNHIIYSNTRWKHILFYYLILYTYQKVDTYLPWIFHRQSLVRTMAFGNLVPFLPSSYSRDVSRKGYFPTEGGELSRVFMLTTKCYKLEDYFINHHFSFVSADDASSPMTGLWRVE